MSRSELDIRRQLKAALESGDLRSELDIRRSLNGGVSPAEPEQTEQLETAQLEDPRGILSKGTDIISAAVEPAITLGTGAAATAIGGLAGIGQALNPFAEEGAAAKVLAETQEALTFKPRTEAGKVGLERTTEDVLVPISEFLDKFRSGERTLEDTDSALLATINEIAPDVLLSMFGLKGLTPKSKLTKVKVLPTGRIEPTFSQAGIIKSKLVNNVDDVETAAFKLDKTGNLISDKLAISAIKQGFGEDVIAMVKGASNQDRLNMKEMINITRKRKANARFASSTSHSIRNRPSDIAGDALLQRFNHVKVINKNAGKLLDRVARTLKGQKADFNTPVNNFLQKLDDMGITFDEGKAIFSRSDIEGLKAPQNAIKAMIKRINSMDSPDAFEMHRFKKFIDENVSFGKTSKGGLSGKTEIIIKGLRKDIDTSLDNTFQRYNNVNTAFAETKTALDSLQNIIGKKIDILGPSGNSAVGTLLRRLEGNAVSRVPIGNAINEIEAVAGKYGGRFDNNIPTLNRFSLEIDKVFGPQTNASFKSEIGESIARGVEGLSSAEAIKGAGRAAIKKARGVNEGNAFRSIEILLNRTD